MVSPFLKDIMGSLFRAPVMGEGCEQFFRGVVSQLIEERSKANHVSMEISSEQYLTYESQSTSCSKPYENCKNHGNTREMNDFTLSDSQTTFDLV